MLSTSAVILVIFACPTRMFAQFRPPLEPLLETVVTPHADDLEQLPRLGCIVADTGCMRLMERNPSAP